VQPFQRKITNVKRPNRMAAYVSERGTASSVGFHGLTTETNACHFTWKDVDTLLCYTLVSLLVLGIGIGSGPYYWIFDIWLLSWYRSNPNAQ